jgi:Ni,Fe-hydrogenase maturation factor
VLHGVQPGSTTLGTELTPTVAAALDDLVDSIASELAGWSAARPQAGAATG